MKTQTAVAIRRGADVLAGELDGPWCRGSDSRSELDVGHHRGEQQREVEQREQVEAQRGAAVGAALQAHGSRHEGAAEHADGDR